MAAATASGSRGGTSRPVERCATRVEQPADRGADHGHAAGHRLERDDAERLVPGHAHHHVGRAQQGRHRRAGRPRRGARPGRRRRAGGRGRADAGPRGRGRDASAGGPPATTSSVPGQRRQRGDHVVDALAGHEAADDHERGGRRAAAAPIGPVGAERGRDRCRTARPSSGRGRRRGAELRRPRRGTWPPRGRRRPAAAPRRRTGRAGLVSAQPWWRRFTTPRAWNVCTTGSRPAAPAGPAGPPSPTSRSGRARRRAAGAAQRRRQRPGEGGHVRPQVVLGDGPWRAGVDVVHLDAGVQAHARRQVRRRRRGSSTVTSHPRPARCVASAATWTFWPPASAPPRAASGLACSDTSSTAERSSRRRHRARRAPGASASSAATTSAPDDRRRGRSARRAGRRRLRHPAQAHVLVAEHDVRARATAASGRAAPWARRRRRPACRPRRPGASDRCCRTPRRRRRRARCRARAGSDVLRDRSHRAAPREPPR